MRILFSLIILLITSTVNAQQMPPLGIQDEGGTISRPVNQINCIGSAVACSKTNTTGTIDVSSAVTISDFDTSQELADILTDETGSSGSGAFPLAAVFSIDPFIDASSGGGGVILGKMQRSAFEVGGILISDDDCKSDHGKWWYDDNEGRFEFCEDNNPLDTLPRTFQDFVLRPTSHGVHSSTDNAIALWDGTEGDFLQDSLASVDDSGNITATNLSGTNTGDVTLSGENYLSLASQVITVNAVNLSGTNATGILAAARFPALTGDVTTSSGSVATTIANNAVSNAKLADVSTATFKGRTTAGTGDPEDLNVTQAKALLNLSGTNTGDQDLSSYVVGPSSATDNAITRFDSTTGKLIQNSGVLLDDNNDITGDGNMKIIGGVTTNGTLVLQANSASSGNTAGNIAMQMKVGNNGATKAITILQDGKVGIGTTTTAQVNNPLVVNGSVKIISALTGGILVKRDNNPRWIEDSNSNTFIGGAGNTSVAGIQNFGLGGGSLPSLVNGNSNVVIGIQSLPSVTDGNNNTALGSGIQAFYTSATQESDTFIGAQINFQGRIGYAGGGYSTVVGAYGLPYAEGDYLTFLGAHDQFGGFGLITGSHNIGIGYSPIIDSADPSYVIAIGDNAVNNSAGSYSTYIGHGLVGTMDNELIIGKDSTYTITGNLSTKKVGIDITPSNITARLHLPAGSTAAASAPLKLTSGSLMTSPEAGAIEFLTNGLYYTQTTGPIRQQIASLAGTETFTNKTLTTPIETGKIDRNDVAVNDNDCTGEQGLYWYDTTDSRFEFCNANSGTPAVIPSTIGDVTGPGSSTDNAIVRFDGTTGKLIQNSGTTIDDNDNILLVNNTAGQTKGFIYKNSVPFLHEYYGGTSNGSNIFLGTNAGNQTMTSSGTLGSYMIGIGEESLKAVTTADSNICIGYKTCTKMTGADSNVAIGQYALTKVISSDDNVAIGFEAGKNITTEKNVVIGFQAGKGGDAAGSGISQSVIIGSQAANSATTATQNVILGYLTGSALTTGDNNTFLGMSAGSTTTTGSDNIMIGLGTGATSASASNQLDIGDVIYGDLSGSGKAGINIVPTSITAQLHINGGSTTANTASLKFETGSLNTTAEEGAFEYVRPYLYFTNGSSAIRQVFSTFGERTLTDGATVALDSSLGSVFNLSASGDRTILAPSNAKAGKRIIIAHAASGGNRTLTLTTGSAGSFRFGTTITGLTITTSGTTDYIECVYNSGADRWDVIGYNKGF